VSRNMTMHNAPSPQHLYISITADADNTTYLLLVNQLVFYRRADWPDWRRLTGTPGADWPEMPVGGYTDSFFVL